MLTTQLRDRTAKPLAIAICIFITIKLKLFDLKLAAGISHIIYIDNLLSYLTLYFLTSNY